MRRARVSSLALPLLLAFGPLILASPPPDVELRDDAYHFPCFADGRHDVNYVEWWYFNFYDEVQDIQVAFTYSVLDPKNISVRGRSGVMAIVYTPNETFHEAMFFGTESFQASTQQADVAISDADPPENSIEVIDEDTYRIVGAIEGAHSVSWQLTYVRQFPAWFGGRREAVGVFPWEQMSWLVYMPGAFVSGEVVIDGRSYAFDDVRGYHDHNWGEWILTNAMWNWAQYFEPGLTLSMGDFRNKPVGTMSIDFGGERIVFEKDHYHLLHTQWKSDPGLGLRYPTKTWIFGENGKRLLIARLQTLETEAVLPPPDIPFLLSRPIIFEQTAHYSGGLWEKNGKGDWELVTLFEGNGFKEYTARQWFFRREE